MFRISIISIAILLLFSFNDYHNQVSADNSETQKETPVKLLRYYPKRVLIPDDPITLTFDGVPTDFKIENPTIKGSDDRSYPKIDNVEVTDKKVKITVTSTGFLKEPLLVSWKGGSAELAFRISEL